MRLEKGYRRWGADLSQDWTPLAAGLERVVDFDKGDFIGRDALVKQRELGDERTLACHVVDGGAAIPHIGEPIFHRDRLVGYSMSGGFGPTIGANIAFAYLPIEIAGAGTSLQIELLGDMREATVAQAPLYDPGNTKLRG
jgi:glycine cleavage system aminomethyltransferase T